MSPNNKKLEGKRLEYLLNKPLGELTDAEQIELETLLDASHHDVWENALSQLMSVEKETTVPEPGIQLRLVKELENDSVHRGFQTRLGSFLSARIPAYQAAAAVAILLIMIMIGGGSTELPEANPSARSISIQYADTTQRDSLEFDNHTGRTLHEDSLLARFRRAVM